MQVVEEIPEALRPEVAERSGSAPHDLTLILCDGDLCVRSASGGFEISRADAARGDPPAELDPLPGVRAGWLAGSLAKHAFFVILLLAYAAIAAPGIVELHRAFQSVET